VCVKQVSASLRKHMPLDSSSDSEAEDDINTADKQPAMPVRRAAAPCADTSMAAVPVVQEACSLAPQLLLPPPQQQHTYWTGEEEDDVRLWQEEDEVGVAADNGNICSHGNIGSYARPLLKDLDDSVCLPLSLRISP